MDGSDVKVTSLGIKHGLKYFLKVLSLFVVLFRPPDVLVVLERVFAADGHVGIAEVVFCQGPDGGGGQGRDSPMFKIYS
jgi:hypothetical protein